MSRSFIRLPSMRFGGHRPPGGGAAGSGVGAEAGAGANPSGGGKIFIFRLFWARAIHPFRRLRFFTSDASGSGVTDGFSSSRRGSAATIGFSAVFSHITIPCPVITGGGRFYSYKFGPSWNESDRLLFSSATACPLSACPIAVLSAPSASCTGTRNRSVWHKQPVYAHRAPFSLSPRIAGNRHPVAGPHEPQQSGVWAARSQSALPCGAVAGSGCDCGGGIPNSAPRHCGA